MVYFLTIIITQSTEIQTSFESNISYIILRLSTAADVNFKEKVAYKESF